MKENYISAVEREKCKKVADAFAELYEAEEIVVLDAGRYGFVKLQYYRQSSGYEEVITYTDSQSMFDDLWNEWLETQLLTLARGTPMEEMSYRDIFRCLSMEKQAEIMERRTYFATKAGLDMVAEK